MPNGGWSRIHVVQRPGSRLLQVYSALIMENFSRTTAYHLAHWISLKGEMVVRDNQFEDFRQFFHDVEPDLLACLWQVIKRKGELRSQTRWMSLKAFAMRLPCPRCDAMPGAECSNSSGGTIRHGYHGIRAKGWKPDSLPKQAWLPPGHRFLQVYATLTTLERFPRTTAYHLAHWIVTDGQSAMKEYEFGYFEGFFSDTEPEFVTYLWGIIKRRGLYADELFSSY